MRDTIDMAREAGGRAQQNKNCDVEYLMSADALEAFEALVRADAIADERDKWMERTAILIRGEREACAKVADRYVGADPIAAAIRARGETK